MLNNSKISIMIFIATFIFVVNCTSSDNSSVKPINLVKNVDETQDDLEKIKSLLSKFRSSNSNERHLAAKKIVDLSNNSDTFRSLAIQEMIKTVDSQAESTIICEDNCYEEWQLSVKTLGKMKAVEATDVLVQKLNYNNGIFGLSLNIYPAAKSVLKIGSPAIPELTKLFSEPKDDFKSYLAIQILYQIKNDEAKSALQNILNKKISQEQREEINRLLNNWSSDKR